MGLAIGPAPGLKFLTTRQIAELDDYLATVAAEAAPKRQGAILTLVLNENGRLIEFGEPLLRRKIKQREA